MTTEEKAKAYAESRIAVKDVRVMCITPREKRLERFDAYDIEQAYEDGATEALASQWVSVEEVEPPIGKLILCRNLVDATLAYYDGEDICEAHDNSIIVRMPFWMSIPIPPLKGDPDTFNETDK